jgi:hypothetical protein
LAVTVQVAVGPPDDTDFSNAQHSDSIIFKPPARQAG